MMQLSVPFFAFFVPNGRSVLSLFPSHFCSVLQCDISPMLENGNWLQTTTTARLPLMLNSLLKFYMSLTSLSGSDCCFCCCRVMNSDWLHFTEHNTTLLWCVFVTRKRGRGHGGICITEAQATRTTVPSFKLSLSFSVSVFQSFSVWRAANWASNSQQRQQKWKYMCLFALDGYSYYYYYYYFSTWVLMSDRKYVSSGGNGGGYSVSTVLFLSFIFPHSVQCKWCVPREDKLGWTHSFQPVSQSSIYFCSLGHDHQKIKENEKQREWKRGFLLEHAIGTTTGSFSLSLFAGASVLGASLFPCLAFFSFLPLFLHLSLVYLHFQQQQQQQQLMLQCFTRRQKNMARIWILALVGRIFSSSSFFLPTKKWLLFGSVFGWCTAQFLVLLYFLTVFLFYYLNGLADQWSDCVVMVVC